MAQNIACLYPRRIMRAIMSGKSVPEQRSLVAGLPALAIHESADHPDAARIATALGAEVARRFGPRHETPLSIFAYDADGALIGGLNGASHWRWLYIRNFWIDPAWRGKGLGRRLLDEAETQARARDCVGLYLDTFDEGAANFYARCGFASFGTIENFPPDASRRFLKKPLV